MTDHPFKSLENPLFRAKEYLTAQYIPSQPITFTPELNRLRDNLKGVLFGRTPPNLLVHGPEGTGKTTLTNYVITALKEKSHETNHSLTTHTLDLQTTPSPRKPLINTRQSIPDTATLDESLDTIYKHQANSSGSRIIILDHLNSLDDPDKLLHTIRRAEQPTKVGIIAIIDTETGLPPFPPKLELFFNDHIEFQNRTADELESIIRDRAQNAFHDDVCDGSVISYCAEQVRGYNGNIIMALNLLSRAGDAAERAGDDAVTITHVDEALSEITKDTVKKYISDLGPQAKLLLWALADMANDSQLPARVTDIMDNYTSYAEDAGHDPLMSTKSVRTYLNDLYEAGILTQTRRNLGNQGGAFYVYNLKYDPSRVLEVVAP